MKKLLAAIAEHLKGPDIVVNLAAATATIEASAGRKLTSTESSELNALLVNAWSDAAREEAAKARMGHYMGDSKQAQIESKFAGRAKAAGAVTAKDDKNHTHAAVPPRSEHGENLAEAHSKVADAHRAAEQDHKSLNRSASNEASEHHRQSADVHDHMAESYKSGKLEGNKKAPGPLRLNASKSVTAEIAAFLETHR